jgi:transposase-like protein
MKDEALETLKAAASSETLAVEFVEQRRWRGEPACPRCGDANVYMMRNSKTGERNKDWRWRCRGCKKMFTVRTGTIFEESRLSLQKWVYVFWRACASKKGISALQIKRELGINYKTALYLMNRVRAAMGEPNGEKIGGPGLTVEADETYHGGKPRFKDPRNMRGPSSKVPIFGVVERGGKARLRQMDRVTGITLAEALHQLVDARSRLVTDDAHAYWQAGRQFAGGHEVVKHSRKEYARGDITTNRIESAFSLFKRGVYGTFHSISMKHLHRYLNEFEFRFNHRLMTDAERTDAAIRAADGKRLTKAQSRAGI